MKIIFKKTNLEKFVNNEKNLGFVPTMGAIHKGHVSLIKKSIHQCDKTIVSIFINKPQFNKKIDYQRYPRTRNKDIAILKKLKVDYIYFPSENEIYPKGPNKKIKISSFKKKLCGKLRPGHFESVVDVIDRFINIIKPKKIYFGEKDMQQLKIVEDFIRKQYIKIKVVSCKTIREKSGIAFSSRNFLLTTKEKVIGSKVFKILIKNKKKIIKNNIFLKKIKIQILSLGVTKIDYIEVLNINKIIRPFKKNNKYKIFIAYYLGNTRLIDNI